MRGSLVLLVFVMIFGHFASSAQAQHAGFVLFGEPTAEASDVADNHRFVHPITAPFESEDSFVTTDLRGWFIYQDIPQSNLLGGGNAKGYALPVKR